MTWHDFSVSFLVQEQSRSDGEPVCWCGASTSSKAWASLPWPVPWWHRGWDILTQTHKHREINLEKVYFQICQHLIIDNQLQHSKNQLEHNPLSHLSLLVSCHSESSLLTEAPPTPSMYKYRPAYNSPGRNHTALTHPNKVHVIYTCTDLEVLGINYSHNIMYML